jgi:asparagine synthetase B (glutamine-hydrolysing)
MCGICGIIDFNRTSVGEKQIHDMMSKIQHRGPDDNGTFIENGIGFGFQRLSILDLTVSGHQPMRSSNGRYTIVFNGEITAVQNVLADQKYPTIRAKLTGFNRFSLLIPPGKQR